VIDMLMTEWNMEDALAVRYEDGFENGREEGLEKAARNALMKGFSVDVVHDITGLDTDTIQNLQL
jgi:predicted transposase YdaD